MNRTLPLRLLSISLLLLVVGCADDPTSGPDNKPTDYDAVFIAHYYAPWDSPHIHFRLGLADWTELPGMTMEAEEETPWFVYSHYEGEGGLEFVFNDGAEEWDNNGDENYFTQLREFWVKDGVIHEAKPEVPVTSNCDDIDCGEHGTCVEAESRCECDEGYLYDNELETCVEDKCAGVTCGLGEVCDPSDGMCLEACTPDRSVGDFLFCTTTTPASYAVIVQYTGGGDIDLAASQIMLNGADVDLSASYEASEKTFYVTSPTVEASKYSYVFRLVDTTGGDIRPLFVPMWIGNGVRYADFTWKDGIMYQIMTDRFLNGDMSNDIDNSQGTLAEVTDPKSQWQGGDFRGIIDKIEDGYFESMGINALWISSPLLNSHNSQPAVELGDSRRFSSYHSYHPIVTGYTHLDDLGYSNPIETAFGTPEELHELVNKAHARGIRVIPDFVANHVQIEAQLYVDHPGWFFGYNPCDGNWDAHRIDCWFTTAMPDFDYDNADARMSVIDHAIWLIQEFNFDGFRADALKHMSDDFVRDLKAAVVDQIETRVDNHNLSEEATVFYMVGESLGGWARYHVRADMVQGQVDEDYYRKTKEALLTFDTSVRDLAEFAVYNDTAYLTSQPTMGQQGGYPGAVMGNFFGNHDQWRALTEAGGDYGRLQMAQTFLFTSPGNIPMLYQGDDIGTYGGQDPDNRAMQRFEGLSAEELASLDNANKAGKAREDHVALRRGTRTHVVLEDWFWVYKVSHGADEVYVAINRDAAKSYTPPAGYIDVLGNCSGGMVPSGKSCIFVSP